MQIFMFAFIPHLNCKYVHIITIVDSGQILELSMNLWRKKYFSKQKQWRIYTNSNRHMYSTHKTHMNTFSLFISHMGNIPSSLFFSIHLSMCFAEIVWCFPKMVYRSAKYCCQNNPLQASVLDQNIQSIQMECSLINKMLSKYPLNNSRNDVNYWCVSGCLQNCAVIHHMIRNFVMETIIV